VRVLRPGQLLAIGLLAAASSGGLAAETASKSASSGQAEGHAPHDAASVSPQRRQERANLLKAAELALSRRKLEPANTALERAALIAHAADTEMAQVRSYMQAGDYRQALAFGAHTAGAHPEDEGGTALYAWLLHIGGQGAVAQRLLSEAIGSGTSHGAGQPLLLKVQGQLKSAQPRATGLLLAPPLRLAPYGESNGLPASARVTGSGLLLVSGTQALVPLPLLPRSGAVWVRNGLGQLSQATLRQRLPALGLALLQLQTALPAAQIQLALADVFPGSVGYAVEYIAAPDAAPAWPLLHTGFMGSVVKQDAEKRLLGIDMPPGPRGGPVFDASGRLAGLALQGRSGQPDQLVTASQLRKALGDTVAGPTRSAAPVSMDQIYETSLRATLQLIAMGR
jgi:tetratricopeptide (TPR) repeat protein